MAILLNWWILPIGGASWVEGLQSMGLPRLYSMKCHDRLQDHYQNGLDLGQSPLSLLFCVNKESSGTRQLSGRTKQHVSSNRKDKYCPAPPAVSASGDPNESEKV